MTRLPPGIRSRIAAPVLLLGLALLAGGCACNRTEEPAAPITSEPAAGAANGGSPPAATAAPLPSAPAPACTVPFATAPVASKATQCPKDPTGNLKLPLGRVTFVDAPGTPSAEVELARDDASRERGLMYRTSMPDDSGMLFSWQDERVRSFWMHNTCIPLDLLYINKDGIISGILEQVPTLNDAPRRVDCPVAHVLELNAGWARAHRLAPGMKVAIEG
jgi:uncharacterized membrane protein (UPF0127 family)